MNVIQRPRAREFCATMQDYIIDTDVTIAFAVKYGGKKILDEEYVPDADNLVRIRGLGKFCELALWGVWCLDYAPQSTASGTFTFLINETEDAQSYVMFSRMQTRKDAASPGILSEVAAKVTRMGAKEYVSGYPQNGGYDITAFFNDGSQESKSFPVSSSEPFTVDVSPDTVLPGFSKSDIASYTVAMLGGSMQFYVDGTR